MSVKFVSVKSGAGNGCANFMRRLEKRTSASAGYKFSIVHKIPRLSQGGSVFWVPGGGGASSKETCLILFLWARRLASGLENSD